MKINAVILIFFVFLLSIPGAIAQKNIVRYIKSFGAKGDGKTNDHGAFQKAAAFFNDRGGNGKLIISKGSYIIGRQSFTGGKPGKPAYEGEDVLHFKNIRNFEIIGIGNVLLKYRDSLRYGSFDPATGLAYKHTNNSFLDTKYAAVAGSCIYFDNCTKISVAGFTINGNNTSMVIGGNFNSGGIQLPHFGIFILNCRNIVIDKFNAHHFSLDGICVSNKVSPLKDSVRLLNSSFEYNSRQGLSWVGGNDLVAKNCKFNHTGKASHASAPSAGVDVEAEVGPIKNGFFTHCEFINNSGAALVASNGESADCTFLSCTFWGINAYSIWVTRPGFTFTNCTISGSVVHGYNSPDEKNATKFLGCTFEDKPYKGKDPFGNYLIESINAKRVSFTGCKFIANKKRLYWISIDPKIKPEEKYQFKDCAFVINNVSDSNQVMVGLMKGVALENCTFEFKNQKAKNKGLSFINFKEGINVDLGGNRVMGLKR